MYITQERLLKYALFSNAFYVFLLFLLTPNGINIEKVVITSFLMFSALTILFLSYLNKSYLQDIPKISRQLFYLMLLWGAVVMIRGFSLDIQDWVTNFGNVYMGLAWFVPVTLIVGLKIDNWKIVFKTLWFMFCLMILALPFFPHHASLDGKLETEWSWLLRPINFVILLGVKKFKFPIRLLTYITFCIYILVTIEAEQRIEYIFLSFSVFFLFLTKIKQIKIKKSLLRIIIVSFVILITLVFTYGYENISLFVSSIIEFKDSRTFLFTELLTDLNTLEKIFGRGSLGTYFSPLFEKQNNYFQRIGYYWYFLDSSTRITVEVGYLQMILKGGFLMLFLTLSLKLQAVYLALFKSNNDFVKRLGLFILILTIISLISFRPAFTPTFILLWISIGTVLSRKNRQMSNDMVKEKLNLL